MNALASSLSPHSVASAGLALPGGHVGGEAEQREVPADARRRPRRTSRSGRVDAGGVGQHQARAVVAVRLDADLDLDVSPPNSQVAVKPCGGSQVSIVPPALPCDLEAPAELQIALTGSEPAREPVGGGARLPEVLDVGRVGWLG